MAVTIWLVELAASECRLSKWVLALAVFDTTVSCFQNNSKQSISVVLVDDHVRHERAADWAACWI